MNVNKVINVKQLKDILMHDLVLIIMELMLKQQVHLVVIDTLHIINLEVNMLHLCKCFGTYLDHFLDRSSNYLRNYHLFFLTNYKMLSSSSAILHCYNYNTLPHLTYHIKQDNDTIKQSIKSVLQIWK
jgi:hypothetical protein